MSTVLSAARGVRDLRHGYTKIMANRRWLREILPFVQDAYFERLALSLG
jgi:hypothetical protein